MIHRLLFCSIIFLTCASTPADNLPVESAETSTSDFNAYWYAGEAEITSYNLKQARYSEIHEGQSVLVFVTEPFNPEKLVKSDNGTDSDVSVLKLNNTKKFNTGIYPYSMMTSTFLPVKEQDHSLKVTSSSQEWCGHTYMELRNKEQFEISIRSYFEGETSDITLDKTEIEDDIWTKIRLNPEALPQGEFTSIPSFFYLRLKHKKTMGYSCVATLKKNQTTSTYTMRYEELNRTLSIEFNTSFPHEITSWKETYPDGWTMDSPLATTEATRIKSIKSAYWGKNSVKDSGLRKKLGLH